MSIIKSENQKEKHTKKPLKPPSLNSKKTLKSKLSWPFFLRVIFDISAKIGFKLFF